MHNRETAALEVTCAMIMHESDVASVVLHQHKAQHACRTAEQGHHKSVRLTAEVMQDKRRGHAKPMQVMQKKHRGHAKKPRLQRPMFSVQHLECK